MPPIFWDGLPPSTPRHGTQVHTVPPNNTVFVRLLGPIQGVWLHWCADQGRKGRSLPCFLEDCPRCPAPTFWKGYAPALLWATDHTTGKPRWLQVVIELTEEARNDLAEAGLADFRGAVIEFQRGNRANAQLHARLTATADAALGRCNTPPPPWFDVRPILERLWGMRSRYTQPAAPAEDGPTAGPPDFLPFPQPKGQEPPAEPKKRRRHR